MSDAPITLYAHTFRSRAERVIWTLEELQLDYTLIRLDAAKGDLQAPEFVRLNPARKIPVLVHGDRVFTESLAIAEYLCALRPDARLLPETPDENYEFRRLIHFTLSEVEAYLWHIFAWAGGRGIALPDNVARYGEVLAQRNAMPDVLRPPVERRLP